MRDNPEVKYQNALEHNAQLLQQIQESLLTTLGPQGLDVCLISNVGDSVSTNDGLTALLNMAVEDPIFDELVYRAKTQEEICGDGTTSLSVLAAEFVKMGYIGNKTYAIHPTIYIRGYKLAYEKAKELLDKYSIQIEPTKENIKKFVKTTLSGKNLEGYDKIYDLCIDAVKATDGKLDNIQIEPIRNGNIEESRLISGVVLDLSVASKEMPREIKEAKILLLDQEIGQVNPAMDGRFNFNTIEELQAFQNSDEIKAKEMTKKIIDSGANVVFCQRDINDYAIDIFTRNKILAIKQVNKATLENLSELTEANIVKNINTLESKDLGKANITTNKLTKEEYILVESNNNKVFTILIGGSGKYTLEEYKRGVEDALGTIKTILLDNRFVIGAGNIEVRLAEDLRNFAKEHDGLVSKVIEDYALCLELIPRVLSVNCGIHPLIGVGTIRLNKANNFGVNVLEGKIDNMDFVLEPTRTKQYILKGATEFACDNVLRVGKILSGRIK